MTNTIVTATTTANTVKKISTTEVGIEKLIKIYGGFNLQIKRGEDVLSIFNILPFNPPLVDMSGCTDCANVHIKIPVTKLDEMIKQKKVKVFAILPEHVPAELPIVIHTWFIKNKRKPGMLKRTGDIMALRLMPGVGFKNINSAIDWLNFRYPS